jgi:hypothetical protein
MNGLFISSNARTSRDEMQWVAPSLQSNRSQFKPMSLSRAPDRTLQNRARLPKCAESCLGSLVAMQLSVMQAETLVLWTESDGLRCLVAAYDDRRYQLRVVRPHGTVRADLFESYQEAVAAADTWREHFSRLRQARGVQLDPSNTLIVRQL